ncbi:hypothetical protein [Candidatus Hodgkinia cicadicola]|uniref:hypothetical protein n=1 Tax=Candidatus Hodgkinia cicadicola TaxID=573658 RepID=UPI0011BADE7E
MSGTISLVLDGELCCPMDGSERLEIQRWVGLIGQHNYGGNNGMLVLGLVVPNVFTTSKG